MKTPDMDDLDALVNGQVEKFLPGYIERHRKEIEDNACKRFEGSWWSPEGGEFYKGVVAALDILAEALPTESTETPPDASCDQDGVSQ